MMLFSIILPGIPVLILRYLIGRASDTQIVAVAVLRLCLWTWPRDNGKIITTGIVGAFLLGRSFLSNSQDDKKLVNKPESIISPGSLKPLIFPCKTTHTRLFPKKHSFGYSYLQVGIPIGWQRKNSILGIQEHSRAKSWLSVSAGDYLARGQTQLGLEGKLRAYLASQGEDLKEYPYAYLLTAPRFLGYAFNPVSFWYLFSKDLKLEAMILEVNNTFDERRMYFMKRGIDFEGGDDQEPKFTHTWPKDFHVSPFNSRKGDYSLAAINPFPSADMTTAKVDNVITLKSSKGHPKIIARIFSTSPALDPDTMTIWVTIRLLSSWFWVGFMTFPRILKEAAKLFWQRGLHVWYRPEVINTSIGRNHSYRENVIASAFLGHLKTQVAESDIISSIEYSPPSGTPLDTVIITKVDSDERSAIHQRDMEGQHIKLQIQTPQFYTDIITALSPAAYVRAAESQPPEARTFSTSSYILLSRLLADHDPKAQFEDFPKFFWSPRAQILARLSYRSTSDVLIFDHWGLTHLNGKDRAAFLQSAIALNLAKGYLSGFDVLLDILQVLLEMTLSWQVMSRLLVAMS